MKKLFSIALCICLTLAAVFTAVPSFATKANADATAEAQTLLSDYYNGGEYIKRTEIYAAGLGVGDVNNFHAKASASNRKTVYSDGNTKLVMTTDPNSLVGTGYKDDTVKGHVVRFTTDENGTEAFSFDVPQYKTIKDWFTDLEEFTADEYTWTKNGNVYTTTSNLDKWVEFIAPMWDAPETVYDFERVTMKNSIEGLTLTLHGRIGEANESEFAKAKITLPKGWYLVTDASTLKADDQIVIVANNADYALSTNQKSSNRGATAITKSGNRVTFDSDVQIITLEAGTVDGTFAFNTGSGYLYAASSSGNQLKTQTNNNANGSWAITITDGVASIVAKESTNRNVMQYNPNNGSPLFACYASASQQALAIYRFIDSETFICKHINQKVDETPATCTEAGSTTTTCQDCGETISTEEIPAGHKFVDGVCSVCGESESETEEPTPDPEPTLVEKWVKVTEAPADWSGEYLIVYEDGAVAFNGGLTTLDAVSNTINVTFSNGEIEATDATKAASFTINADGHVISKSGYYIGQSSNANGLKSSTSTTYNHTISINDDGTVNLTSGGAYLRYNATSGQYRFRYYKSSSYTSQKAICLYKLVEA